MADGVTTRAAGLFRPVGAETKELVAGLVAAKQPIFGMPAWFVTAEAAHVAYLLSDAVDTLAGGGGPYRSFFANSRHEALHAAIKLTRHRTLDRFAEHAGRVVVVDPGQRLHHDVDPLGAGPAAALVPGVVCVPTLAAARAALGGDPACGLVVRAPHGLDPAELAALVAQARRDSALVTLDLADAALTAEDDQAVLRAVGPDLVVVGERLTDGEVPFGALVGTTDAFVPWAEPGQAFLHSNTYGGNSVAMRKVRETLLARLDPAGPACAVVARADASNWPAVLDLYATHVNAETVRLHRMLRGALHIVEADGARLTVELDSGRRLGLVDAVCGGGLGVNGHNPADARTAVLDRHDPATDYRGALEELLADEVGLPRLFAAVSGAGAVDTALTLALLAQSRHGRRRIVVFDHNYGGKTLVALLATAAATTRAPFGPLYDGVRYLDPFAPDAVARFEEEVAAGDVALVWLELVHGSSDSYAALPDDLLAAVSRERQRRGFLVGVDEILTSSYRCGRRWAHHGRVPDVDVLTLSKALSYLCFPMAATVVSETVYQDAYAANPTLVGDLSVRYVNQLGAHFGLHSLRQMDALGLPDRTAQLGRDLADAVAGLPPDAPSIGRRFAEGLFVRLEMRPARLPGRFAARAGELSLTATTLWWITRARVFVLYDCFGPALVAQPEDLARVTDGLRRLGRTSPRGLVVRALLFQARQALLARLRRLIPRS